MRHRRAKNRDGLLAKKGTKTDRTSYPSTRAMVIAMSSIQ